MANRQYSINLSFTADTTKARKSLASLQEQIQKLVINTGTNQNTFGISKDIQEATKAAATLKIQLDKATNVSTGKLDLGRFSESLKKSGMTLEQYGDQLKKLGPDGEQVFTNLAQNIMQAEMPLKRTNKLVELLWGNLKRQAGWQLTNNVIHAMQGAIERAYYYAQDLNESLNGIRIVTGKSTEQMAQFAKEANEAAKALSTTTTNYTMASQTFYQQGYKICFS